MAGIALKGQCDLVSIMVPPEVPLKEKFSWKESVKKCIFCIKVESNGGVLFFCNFGNSVIFIRVVFLILEVLKEFVLNFMFETVNALSWL